MGVRFNNLAVKNAIVVVFFLMCVTPVKVMSMGSQNTKNPAIALHCPQDVPQSEALCEALTKALVEALPTRRITAPDPSAMSGTSPDNLEVTLRLDDVSSTRISGHLEWRNGVSDDLLSGPRVNLDVMDATLSPAFYAQFSAGLIGATPQLLADLK